MTPTLSKKHSRTRWASLMLATSVLVTGCFDQNPAQLVEQGKKRMEKKEYKAAVIEFKNALQKDASLTEARFMLGKALLESGDVQGAWVELSKAREAGYDKDELVPPMAAALILRGQTDKFIAEYGDVQLTQPKRQAELKAALATAYGGKGQFVQARAAADAALKADPDNIVAQLTMAQLRLIGGDKEGAAQQIEQTLKAHPESGRPWMARAELLQSSGADAAEVMAAYQQAVKREPDNVAARLSVFNLSWRQHDLAAMDQQLQELRKALPGNPYVNYFAAALALERKDLKTAQENTQQLLKVAPDNARFLQLAGMVEYERGGYLQAAAHLGKALAGAPSQVAVRTLLARAQLRAGDPRKALAAVQPLLEDKKPVAEVYSVAADAYLQMGDGENAKKMYTLAVKANPQDTRGRTVLALTELDAGRTDRAMTELKSVAATDQGAQADAVMFMTYLRAKQLDQAMQVAAGLEKKQPDRAIAPYFRGLVEMQRGDAPKAREAFELAVKRVPGYLPAVIALANFDAEAGKPEAAVARFERAVAADPRSVDAQLELITARARAGTKPADVRTQLEAAVKDFPDADKPRLALATLLIDMREYKPALQMLQDALNRTPDNPQLQEMLGAAQLAAGDYNQALQAFSKMAALQPNSVVPLMHMARVQVARKDVPATISQLRKALAVKPDHPPAVGMLVTLLARTGKVDEAIGMAKQVQSLHPAEAIGWVMEGDLQIAKGNRAATLAAYRTALVKEPQSEVAIKLHRQLLAAGQAAEATKFQADWLGKQPDDPMFNYYLGDRALAAGDYGQAETLLRKSLIKAPRNAVAMNNIAWLLQRGGKPGALEMAEKAVAIQPANASFIDTAAEIYAANGKLDKALSLQRRALELDSQQPQLRWHLAQYLVKSGQKNEARAELQTLSLLGSNFPQQDEVQKLLSSL